LMFWGTNDVLWLAVLGVAIMSALIIRLGIVHFKRESLLGREIDMLNLSWVWQTFRKAFSSSEKPAGLTRYLAAIWNRQNGAEIEKLSLRAAIWYREDIARTLRRLAPSFWVTLAIGAGSILAAYYYVNVNIQQALLPDENIKEALTRISTLFTGVDSGNLSASILFWHNLRAELVILLMGIFSFGVLSLFAFIGNFALIGAVLGFLPSLGLSPWLVCVSGILPHGIAELTSIILLSAAAFHMGLRLVTPEEGRSIGETLIVTFADVVKILIAVCIPLLILAALVEANLTPRILIAAIGHSLDIQP
jgi:uncharacterized membrane protein SpoIIM required for sporulation